MKALRTLSMPWKTQQSLSTTRFAHNDKT